jgi:hypothetical protein
MLHAKKCSTALLMPLVLAITLCFLIYICGHIQSMQLERSAFLLSFLAPTVVSLLHISKEIVLVYTILCYLMFILLTNLGTMFLVIPDTDELVFPIAPEISFRRYLQMKGCYEFIVIANITRSSYRSFYVTILLSCVRLL